MDVPVNVFIWFTFMHGDNFQMQDRADGRVVLAIEMSRAVPHGGWHACACCTRLPVSILTSEHSLAGVITGVA